MVTGQAGGVLRQLHRLLGTDGLEELNDGQLLEQFVARRDEAAFAALVRRHGPMVLGVCRRLLRGGADADDAFQATFLVLFRRARALDRRASLAGYLYTVAYHVALRARAASARRRSQERQVVDMPRAECRAEEVWRDLQPVLDDELNRLPDKYREPVLLCYVEGKTNEEAGRLLRLPTGTVKSRLARARELLKGRLSRRGITLTAGLLVAVLAGKAAAAVSPLLLDTTIQTTLRLAAGQAAGPAAALAEGVLKAMFATRLKIATAFLLAAGALAVGIGVGLCARPAQAQRQDEAPAAGAKEQARDPGQHGKAPAQAEERTEIAITGRVLDPDGKPVAGAQVAVARREVLRFSIWERYVIDRTELTAKTTTDAEGRFHFTVPRPPPITRREVRVVARAPGHGLGWTTVNPDATRAEAEVRLLPEARVAGKVVDLQGGPVAGLKISATRLTRRGARPDALPVPDDALTATTDKEGRFAFQGVGRLLTVHLEINDVRFAPKELDVDTGNQAKAGNVLLGLAPGQVIEGRVLYADTKKPVPHAHLEVDSYSKSEEGYINGGGAVFGQTDAEGRFKISTYPGSTGFISATPPPGQPYLVNSRNFDWPKGTVKQELEVTVPRGILVRGKITEAPSGKPVAGASVEYQIPRDDVVKRKGLVMGWAARVLSAADGSYAIAVPPVPGHLLVTAPTPDYVAEPLGSAELELGKPGGDPVYYHASSFLALKEDARSTEKSFTLRRGVTLRGSLVDPDGKPVKTAVMFCGGFRPAWEKALSPVTVHDGRWDLRGCDPERTYHLLFLACRDKVQEVLTAEAIGSNGRLLLPMLLGPKNKLGAAVDVSAKKSGAAPVEVHLKPTGSARLHFRDAQGKQLSQYNPALEVVIAPGPTFPKALETGALAGETVYLAAPLGAEGKPPAQADGAGALLVEGLIPGATYRLRQFQQAEVLKEFTAESGKRLDVDITVQP
jgi:RNA polymerase sigma factor (sigma-70 family)